jgi:hypothetical protein
METGEYFGIFHRPSATSKIYRRGLLEVKVEHVNGGQY